MKRYIILLIFGFISMLGFAHQPEISSTVLAEKENNIWVLQISASLTAFQQEINTHFSENPYQTPEEFREMIVEHIKNNFHMHFSAVEHIILKKGVVHLGHETKVIFEVSGIPEDLQSFEVSNTTFMDVHNSNSLLVILKEGVDKNKFILNADNNFSSSLMLEGRSLIHVQSNKAFMFSWPLLVAFIGLIVAGILATRFNLSKSIA